MKWSTLRASRRDAPLRRRSFRPALETLEDRMAPSANPGIFDPSTATWYLRSTNSAGGPDAGQFQYGAPGSIAVVGDWDGDGDETIGVFDPNTATWSLRNSTNAGTPDAGQFQYGGAGFVPVVGDWDGNGTDGIGVFDPATATWFLRNTAGAGAPDAGQVQYGAANWLPVVGDWAGDNSSGIGVFDPASATWYLRNSSDAGAPDAGQFQYGTPGWTPLAGDWSDDGSTGVGVLDPGSATWYLRNTAGAGAPDAGQFQYGAAGWQAVVGDFTPTGAVAAATSVLSLKLKPIDINLLGLQVQTSAIQVDVSALPGNGKLLGNLLTTVSNLINLQGVNAALNNVLDSVVTLLNSTALAVNGVTTDSGPLFSAPAGTTSVLDLFVAPVHLDLLGALVDTSPIHLTIKAHSGDGLILGNVVTLLANLFNPPLPNQLDLDFINTRLQNLLSQLGVHAPGIGSSPTTRPPLPAGTEQILSLDLAPINLNLLGLVLKTSQIQVNVDAQTGNGELLGNVLTTLLNTLGATPDNLQTLSNNLNALLAKVIGILNVSSLLLDPNVVNTLSQVLQTLALPNLVVSQGTASAPILDLVIASPDGTTPPVQVDLLGVVVTTSNIHAELLAQTGEGQILGNLLFNVANLLNPGGSINLLTILGQLGL